MTGFKSTQGIEDHKKDLLDAYVDESSDDYDDKPKAKKTKKRHLDSSDDFDTDETTETPETTITTKAADTKNNNTGKVKAKIKNDKKIVYNASYKNEKFSKDNDGDFKFPNKDTRKDFLKIMNSNYGQSMMRYHALGNKNNDTKIHQPDKAERAINRNAQKIGVYSTTLTDMSNFVTATSTTAEGPVSSYEASTKTYLGVTNIIKGVLGCILLGKKMADTVRQKDIRQSIETGIKMGTTLISLVAGMMNLLGSAGKDKAGEIANYILPINNSIDCAENVLQAVVAKSHLNKLTKLGNNDAKYATLIKETKRTMGLSITNAIFNIANTATQLTYAIAHSINPESDMTAYTKKVMAFTSLGTSVLKSGVESIATSNYKPGGKKAEGAAELTTFATLADSDNRLGSKEYVNNATEAALNTKIDSYLLNKAVLSSLGANFRSYKKAGSKAGLTDLIKNSIPAV